jgi:hypothetical protein
LIIVPGLGISNVVASGMTLAKIVRATGDAVVTKIPEEIRMPWDNSDAGRLKRLPWERQDYFRASIPSLGVHFSGPYRGMNQPYYGHIDFDIVPDTNSLGPAFAGALSCGLSFAGNSKVTRKDVVDVFGAPEKQVHLGGPELLRLLEEVASLSVCCPGKDGRDGELLYYPAEGIMFDLQDDVVVRVGVHPKAKAQR